MIKKEIVTREDGSKVMRYTDVHDVPIDVEVTNLLSRQAEQTDIQVMLDDLQTKGVDVQSVKTKMLRDSEALQVDVQDGIQVVDNR